MEQANLQKPDNYLVWSVLSTVLCCLPLGIVAIIASNKVDSEWNAGRHEEAIAAANQAKKFAMFAAIGGVVATFLSIVIYAVILLIAGNM